MKRLFAFLVFLLAVHALDSDFVEDQDLPADASAEPSGMDLKKKPKLNKCKTSKDCEPTHYCKSIKVMGKKVRLCVRRGPPVPPCPPSMGPRTKPCSRRCRCGLGQGPCTGHATCKMGLRCRGEPGKCGPPMPPMPKKTNTEPPAGADTDAGSSEPDDSSAEPSSSEPDDSSYSSSEPSSSEPDDNEDSNSEPADNADSNSEPADSSSAEPDDVSAHSNSEPASAADGDSTSAEPATEDAGDDENDANPYDLMDMCKKNRDCAVTQMCKVIRAGSRKMKICVPRLAGALDDDSEWDFFEDAAVTAEDLKKKPKKCKKHSDCKKPRVCAKKKGKKKGRCIMPPKLPPKMTCPPPFGPRKGPCSMKCKCGLGQGKCSSPAVCMKGLSCTAEKCTKSVVPKPAPKTTGKAMSYKDDIAALNSLGSSKDVDNSDDTETDVIPDDDDVDLL